MKKNKRFFGVMLLTIVLILVSIVPVSAKTNSTPFSGSCGFLAEPPSPDVRLWYTDQNVLHMRNEIQAVDCDFNDDRLDGVYMMVINWDVKEYTDPFWYIIGHDYGKVSLVNAGGSLLWEGFRNTFYSAPWVFNGQIVMHGRGAYAGLWVMADVWGDFTVEYKVYMAGTITDPGN